LGVNMKKRFLTGSMAFAMFMAAGGSAQAVLRPINELALSEPVVYLYDADSATQGTAKVGQLIQAQISYPISPPFPVSADIQVTPGQGLVPRGVYRTPGKIAALGDEPQQSPGIGVGYLSAFVRAQQAGEVSFIVRIKMSDGKVKKVPFNFTIEE
jgi:hypothetical protein